jgi:hypothetical protein
MQVNLRVSPRVLLVLVSVRVFVSVSVVSVSVSVCCTAHRYRSHRRAAWPCHRLSSVLIMTSRCAGRCLSLSMSILTVCLRRSGTGRWMGEVTTRVWVCMLLQIVFCRDQVLCVCVRVHLTAVCLRVCANAKVLPTRAQTFNSQHAATALRDPTTGSLLSSQADRIYWGGMSVCLIASTRVLYMCVCVCVFSS